MKKLLFAFILGMASVSFADQASKVPIGPFGGLNNRDNAAIISASQAQDLLNVNISVGGKSVKKRPGYAQAFALQYTTSPVHGTYLFYNSAGNDVVLAFHDRDISASVAGGSMSVLLTTATNNSTFQCSDYLGFAYCVDSSRDALYKTDGAGVSLINGIVSTGTMVAACPTRLAMAGFSGSPARIDFSADTDFTTWGTGSTGQSPVQLTVTSPGSRITHITYAFGRLMWFKETSFGYVLIGNQPLQTDWVIKTISNTIGTLDNSSTQDFNGNLYFRGQDGHIYVFDGANVTKLSREIQGTVSTGQSKTPNSWTQTSSTDFDSGSFSPSGVLSDTVTANAVQFISNPSETDTTTTDFSSGTVFTNIDTTSVSGQIGKKWFLFDDWNDGNLTTNPPWTKDSGTFAVVSSELDSNPGTAIGTFQAISSTFTQTSGTWRINGKVITAVLGAQSWSMWIMAGTYQSGNGNYASGYCATYAGISNTLSLSKSDSSGNLTQLASGSVSSPGTTFHSLRVTRSSAGVMSVYWDEVLQFSATDTSNSSSARVALTGANINVGGSSTAQPAYGFDDFYYSPAQDGTGALTTVQSVFESRVFDFTAGLLSYQNFVATISTATGQNVSFFTNASSDGSTFDGYVATSTGATITSATKRYMKYKAVLTSPADGGTTHGYFSAPTIQDVTLQRTLNARYDSAVKNAPLLTSWDSFVPTTIANGGTFNFYIRSSTVSFTVTQTTPTWTAVTSNSVTTVSTGTYFQVRSSFTVTSSTQNPILYDFTQNWFEGSAADKAYAAFFDDKVWFSVPIGSGQSTNNRILIYDLLFQGWTLYDLPSNGFYVRNNALYFGSSNGGYVYKYGVGNNDAGAAINAYWKSKDFFGGSPFNQTVLTDLSVAANSVANSTITVTYTTDDTTSNSFTMGLGSGSGMAVKNKNLPLGISGQLYNVKFSNNAVDQPWEVYGAQVGVTSRDWRAN